MEDKILHWFFNSHVGSSSKTLAAIALGLEDIMRGFDRPHDSSDFYRCYELVKAVPEVKQHFGKVKVLCPDFGPIIDRWDELCALWESDKRLSENRCDDLIRSLNEECHIAGGWQKTPYGWTKPVKAPF